MMTHRFRIFASDVCRATINRMHCCFSMAQLSMLTLLKATYVYVQYKGNAMLPFHTNECYANAPQY